ncbi:MAG: hypothetical protein ACYDDI_11535 [Candidatus Acidiferrales bacterium]
MTAVLFILLAFGMVKAKTRRQVLAVVLIGVLAVMVIAPPAAQAQVSIIAAIQAVLNTINGVIHTALASVQTVRATISNFYQQATWPLALINQARALVAQMINQYRSQMSAIFHLDLSSATLPATQALEQVIRNPVPNDFSALVTNYRNVYGAVPGSSQASPWDQNMMDMDDALALDTFKTLKESDDASEITLGVADQLENSASQAAPGSSPYLTASAVVASINSQAQIQKMVAADLRQEAGYLAHRTAFDKEGARSASALINALTNVLR